MTVKHCSNKYINCPIHFCSNVSLHHLMFIFFSIMKVLCRDLRLEAEFDFPYLASVTPGYVGADLMALCREAALCAVTRYQCYQRSYNFFKHLYVYAFLN